MKNLFTTKTLLTLLMALFISNVHAQLITVDGTAEAAWDAAQWRAIDNVIQGEDSITSAVDFSAQYKFLWDAQGIYVLVDVKDDVLTNDQAEYFNNDMVEIYFDMDNSKNILKPGAPWNVTAYDDNDFQFHYVIGRDTLNNSDVDLGKDLSTPGTYMLEMFFDWADLGLTSPLVENDIIGFDVTVGDNDNGTARHSYLGWNTPSGEAYHDPSLFGTLELASGNLATVPTGIIIDGKPDPVWYDVPTYTLGKTLQGTTGGDELSGSFKVYYDTEGIYVWAVVLDDTLTTQGSGQYFNNDFMEIYFDMDNSKNPLPEGSWWNVSSYDDNDYQYKFIFSQDTIFGGPNKLYSIAQSIDTGSFYAVEMLFPWDSLGYTLNEGDTLGFDVVVGDNDSTTQRQRMIGWNAIDGESYHDASRFGTLVLAENGTMVKPEGITIDGKRDPLWSEIERRPIKTLIRPADAETITNDLDFSGYHQLYWTDTAIYLLVQVNDDTLTTTDELQYWQVDNVEVYWDMDNSKNPCPGCAWNVSSYDGNDFQYQLKIGAEELNHYAEFSQNIFEGGYLIEYKFLLDSMNYVHDYVVGDKIGFDVYITDNDDNITRDAQLTWFDDSGEAYHIGSKFGTIELLENGMTAPSNECEVIPPLAPANLVSENKTASFTISWDPSEDNIATVGYEVYRVDESEDVLVGTVVDPTIEIFAFESEATYSFKVRAFDECGNFSPYSPEIEIVAPLVLKYNVVKSGSTFTIDGKADEEIWASAEWDTLTLYKLDNSNITEDTVPKEQDLSITFALTWDDDNLYAFVNVADADVVTWDGTSNDWPTRNVPFQFDALELMIASSNERYGADLGSFKDGDTQWRFNPGTSVITGGPVGVDFASYNVEFAEGISLRLAGGYTLEIQFPWDAVYRDVAVPSELGIGTEMLFDVGIIDNDGRKDGDMFLRDHEVHYADATGQHWRATAGYKVMVLDEMSSIFNTLRVSTLSVYPNPTSNMISVSSNETIQTLKVYNKLGQVVKMVNDVNQSKYEMSVEELPEGIYFIKGVSVTGKTYMNKVIKE